MCCEGGTKKQGDQEMGKQIADFGFSGSHFQSLVNIAERTSSFLRFIGFDIKGLSIPSSSLLNPFRTRTPNASSRNASTQIWDCSELGLKIINPSADEMEPFLQAFDPSNSKNIVIGNQSRASNPKTPLTFQEKQQFSPTLTTSDGNLGIRFPKAEEPTFKVRLSRSEMKLSEDYTCITSHGPNAKMIHVFGDHVFEELDWQCSSVASASQCFCDEFLSFCYSCKRKLKEGEDIYMYRGEKAFCSDECRRKEICTAGEIERNIDG